MLDKFREIEFGWASAESESAERPELLTRAFLDLFGVSKIADGGSKFLFLGYKGSGKSAIGKHLKLSGEGNPTRFVSDINLGDFPFSTFAKIVRGDDEPESKYPMAWSWLLLLATINSLCGDEGLSTPYSLEWGRTVNELRGRGFLANPDITELVRKSAKKQLKLNLKIFEHTEESGGTGIQFDVPEIVSGLMKLVMSCRSNSRHVIVLDGLDEIVVKRDTQAKILGALVFRVERLNQELSVAGVPVKILLMCRTDLFEKISGANKNKVRQDKAVELDWFHDPRDRSSSNLVKIANLRAQHALGDGKLDVISLWFPREIATSKVARRSTEAIQFLLDLTRHTPRDFLQLLKKIQSFHRAGKLTNDQIMSGVRQYSIEYFLPEILDELEGSADAEEKKQIVDLFSILAKREFTMADLEALLAKKSKLTVDRTKELLHVLFECSALGNVERAASQQQSEFFTFRYRNRHSSLKLEQTMLLHRGLWLALQLK